MDDILGTVDLGVSTDSEAMEQELRLESEQELNQTLNEEMRKKEEREQRLAGKRVRQDDEEIVEEDGFVTVIKGHKRLNRKDLNNDNLVEEGHQDSEAKKYIIICMTGKEVLPKQFGMAKLLRSLNIENIVKMIYKSAYRVLIHFGNEESAVKLLKSEKLSSLGYRAQRADETTFCYGILRQIDLETEEQEILENLSCEHEIISIKRLRRMSDSGEWIDSEMVRICFKGKGSQEIYTKSESIERNRNINDSQLDSTQNTQKTSYRDIVITETLINNDSSTSNKVIEGKSSGRNHIEKERALERKNTEAGRSDGNRKTREKGNGESEAR
ncbi:unnamed protein product [Parnassius mnemosyne]|uniref:Uncharacterized protein n=1 Tax=Parnassius mnemosyne TaxID=213953 RepID=A0AAV1K9X8_9NEOP